MNKLSPHFSREEFACRCGCGFDTVDAELITVLEKLRSWAKTAILINCGARCKKRNTKVGGAPNSQHLVGRAADIRVPGKTPEQIAEYLEQQYPDTYGIGLYDNFVHIDTRAKKSRWVG